MRHATTHPTSNAPQADPHAARVELTVIVPTRNEASNITPLLDRLEEALDGRAVAVLFVDDSTDDTPHIIRAEAERRTIPVSVIARPEERRDGLSGAVVEGMEAVGSQWLCVIDADLQHPPEVIPQLLDQANRTAADIVVASRQADLLGPIGLSRARALTSQLLTLLARIVFPRVLKNVSDPLTGFFLVRREAINTADLQPDGFKILLEILVRHPDLRVTERHFNFAPRHEGQSKADLNEGMRFFRHLLRLRLTVNQHLVRFLIVVGLALVLNLSLLGGLTAAGLPVGRAAAIAGGLTITGVLLGEMWIFSDRPRGPFRRRLAGVLLLGALLLFIAYLPVVWLLVERLGVPVILAGLAAMGVLGFVYYLLSEQWIWTRGLMMRPRASVYYDIHGIVAVASQIPLQDLSYFRVTPEPSRIDLQIRVDRHGTPSCVSNAICYDEHLGRFGFGLTVIPGDFTEIVVSPLLETSPGFVYTNVVEPVLRWVMVTRGYSLARAGAVRMDGGAANDTSSPALLVTGRPDLSYGLARLCRDERMAFMGDDRIIVGRDNVVHSFPKPVTAAGEMQPEGVQSWRAAVALRLQRVLYSRPIRQLGLFLGRWRLPAATVNTYLQRLIPQPKYPLNELSGGIACADEATPATLILLDGGEPGATPMPLEQVIERLLEPGDAAYGFRPYPLLVDELSRWAGRDWLAEERDILRAAFAGCRTLRWGHAGDRWWEPVAGILRQQPAAGREQWAGTFG